MERAPPHPPPPAAVALNRSILAYKIPGPARKPEDEEEESELTTSTTRSITHVFSHQFTVEDFSLYLADPSETCPSNTPRGDNVLRSNRFGPSRCPGLLFYLKLYPRGYKEENKDFFSFFLCFISNDKEELMMKYSVYILNAQGEKKQPCHISYHKVIKGRGLGIPQYVSRAILLDPDNALLPNDTLTILCDIKILSDQVTESPMIFPEPNPHEQHIRSARSLTNCLANLLESGDHSDVTLVVGGKEIRAHKALLVAMSPVFSAMFSNSYLEGQQGRVEIADLSAEVLEQMLRFIYTAKVEKLDSLAIDLLEAADKYDIPTLKQTVGEYLTSKIRITTVSALLNLADRHSVSLLKRACIEYITKQPEKILEIDGWKSVMNVPELAVLLYQNLVHKTKPPPAKRQKTSDD